MKLIYKVSGVIFIIGCIFLVKFNLKKITTYTNGYYIEATILYVPNCLLSNRHYHIKFSYKEKVYAKEIGVLKCKKLKVGESIRLKTNIRNDIFLYEYENPYQDLISFFLLLLFGFYLIYLGFRSNEEINL